MATESIDIEIKDRVPDSIRTKILNIAQAALEGQNNVDRLAKALGGLNKSAAAQSNAAIAATRHSTAQQKLAQATAQATAAQARATQATLRLEQAQERAARRTTAYSQSFAGFARNLLAVAGAGLGVRALVGIGDAYTTLQNKLQNVATSQEQVNELTNRLFEIANRTRAPIEGTVTAFSRFDRALKGLGKSQEDSLRLTETVNKALVIGGASTTEAAAALLQLSQAFNSGKLQGDEFRSLAENMPIVLDAIAKATNTPINQIKKMSTEGKITADVLYRAFKGIQEQVDATFANTVPTVSQALVVLENNVSKSFGEFNKATGFTETLSKAILFLSKNVDILAVAAVTLGAGLLVAFGPQVITAILAVGAAIAANPIGLLVIAIAAVASALYIFKDDIKIVGDGVTTLGDLFRSVFDTIGDIVGSTFDAFRSIFGTFAEPASLTLSNLLDLFKDIFNTIVDDTKKAINIIIGVFVGMGKLIGISAADLPATFELVFKSIANFGIGAVEKIVNTFLSGFRKLGDIVDIIAPETAQKLASLGADIKLPRLELTSQAKDIGSAMGEALTTAFTTDYVGNIVKGAQTIAQARVQRLARDKGGEPTLRGAGKNTNAPDAAKGGAGNDEKRVTILERINGELDKQLRSYGLLASERFVQQRLDEIDIQLAAKKLPLLTKVEKAGIEGKLKQIELNREIQHSQDQIYDGVVGPQKDFQAGLIATNILLERGLISEEKAAQSIRRLSREYEEATNPLAQFNRDITEQTNLLTFHGREQEVQSQLLQLQNQLRSRDIELTEKQTQAIISQLTALQQKNAVNQQENQLLQNSVEARRQIVDQITAINNLSADPKSGFTQGDGAAAVTDIIAKSGLDTSLLQVQASAYVQTFTDMYATIDKLRAANLIGEQDAAALRAQTWVQAQGKQLEGAQTFFTSLEALSKSNNSKLAAIGKAAAISNAIIDTYKAATGAYASLASIPYVGPALGAAAAGAAIAAGLANVAQIRNQKTGFASGGYTGDYGTSNIAGVVHGQEFVTNAAATARNRPALEAMNRGATVGMGGGGVVVNNYGTPQTYEKDGVDNEGRMRLIARDVVANETPGIVAGEFQKPNSRVSKSLRESHNVTQKR